VYELPIIRVDDAHFHKERDGGEESEIYRLSAGPGFILDATGYTFRIPLDLGGQPPNLIQLVRSAGHTYERAWQEGKTRYVITGDTLIPAKGSVRLRMFETGEVIVLAIGKFVSPGSIMGKGKFYPYWVSMIYVC
jgi:hypothetical protein